MTAYRERAAVERQDLGVPGHHHTHITAEPGNDSSGETRGGSGWSVFLSAVPCESEYGLWPVHGQYLR